MTRFGNVAYLNNWADFLTCLKDPLIRSINLTGNITADTVGDVPLDQTTIKEVEGHGFRITVKGEAALRRNYTSLSAASQGIDQQLRFRNVEFYGNGTNMALSISANYGMRIEGCRFYNFKKAVDLRWCMDTVIDQCFFWENYIGISLDWDKFTGGSTSASQSNHGLVQNCKFRNSAGHFANIQVIACSGTQILHNIFEGDQKGGDYDVFFDDAGSSVVKDVLIYGNHVEHQPRIAAFYVKIADGIANVGGIFSQYDCTLVRFESSGYAKCVVRDIPVFTPNTKFMNVRGEGRWWFTNVAAVFNPNTASYWEDGKPPINSRLDNWDTNGQAPYILLGTRRV